MTATYVAHICNGKDCKIEGVQIFFKARGYDDVFEKFAESNASEMTDETEIHVFRYDFDRMERKSNGYFGKFKNWKPNALEIWFQEMRQQAEQQPDLTDFPTVEGEGAPQYTLLPAPDQQLTFKF